MKERSPRGAHPPKPLSRKEDAHDPKRTMSQGRNTQKETGGAKEKLGRAWIRKTIKWMPTYHKETPPPYKRARARTEAYNFPKRNVD